MPGLPLTNNHKLAQEKPAAYPAHPSYSRSDAIAYFEQLAENAGQVQEALLHDILRENAGCEYLQNCGLVGDDQSINLPDHHHATVGGSSAMTAAFKQHVPIVTHSDIKPYIDRIVGGENSAMVLTAAPIDAMSLSSGTTETKEKFTPFYDWLNTVSVELASITAAYRDRVLPPITPGAKILDFLFAGKYFNTKDWSSNVTNADQLVRTDQHERIKMKKNDHTSNKGLPAGTVTTHLIRGGVFKARAEKVLGAQQCSPDEVFVAADCQQAMYCHLLCGLVYCEEVELLTAIFAYTLLEAFRMLQTEWQQLCHDIRVGELSSAKVTNPALRMSIARTVLRRPNPSLADMLHAKCSKLANISDWHGLIPQLWPKCKYVLTIMSGAMEPYTERLQHYAGNSSNDVKEVVQQIPLVCGDYGASEGWVAININPCISSPPQHVSFTIAPHLAYFEFIPLLTSQQQSSPSNCINDQLEGQPINMTQVQVGQEYEIVLTTRGGLYRYRLGDVVRVTGFFKSCPQFRFMHRKNVVLSINIDKNTEKDLTVVVDKAAKKLAEASAPHKLRLVDYTSYAHRYITTTTRNTTTKQLYNTNSSSMPGDQVSQNSSSSCGHYVIFWELNMGLPPHQNKNQSLQPCTSMLAINDKMIAIINDKMMNDDHGKQTEMATSRWLAECASLMDAAFVEPGYVVARKMKSIGPLQLCVVKQGTFSKLMNLNHHPARSLTQYKTPRCIVSPHHLAILHSSIVSTHISSAYT